MSANHTAAPHEKRRSIGSYIGPALVVIGLLATAVGAVAGGLGLAGMVSVGILKAIGITTALSFNSVAGGLISVAILAGGGGILTAAFGGYTGMFTDRLGERHHRSTKSSAAKKPAEERPNHQPAPSAADTRLGSDLLDSLTLPANGGAGHPHYPSYNDVLPQPNTATDHSFPPVKTTPTDVGETPIPHHPDGHHLHGGPSLAE